jgi:hypothetical protein
MPDTIVERGRSRAAIIATVQTPLGFFALVVLVVEALLTVAVGITRDDVDPVYILAAMLGLIFLLVVLVTSLAFFRPEALSGKRAAVEPAHATVEQVDASAVLCLHSNRSGLGEQLVVVRRAFPNVDVRVLESTDLRAVLAEKNYEIVHYVAAANPGEINGADQLADVLEQARPSLIVLIGNTSLHLVARLAQHANVIAAPAATGDESVLGWLGSFYEHLASGMPLSWAHQRARAQNTTPVLLALQNEVRFSR